MAFNQIVVGTKTWNMTSAGLYVLSTSSYGGVADTVKLSPGRAAGLISDPRTPMNASITRRMEADATVNNVTTRHNCTVSVNFTLPRNTTALTVANLVTLLSEINTFSSAANLQRLFLGES